MSEPTHLSRTHTSYSLRRTETASSLRRELSNTPSDPDYNAPIVDGTAEFPEEYTMETETGLVPQRSLRELRGVADSEELEKGDSSSGSEIEYVTFTVNDPDNPQNWSSKTRWLYTLCATLSVVCVAFGSACPAGAVNVIARELHVGPVPAILSVSMMVIGFMLGPLLWSPLSEQIGRRPVYAVTMLIYVIFNIPCALAKNIGTMLVCRFLCGVFAASGLSNAGGTIADLWSIDERGTAIAFFAAAPYCGPVLGPIVSGWIAVGTDKFALVFWVNMAFAGFTTIVISLVPETYAPVILKHRAKKLRKETGNPNIMTEQEAKKATLSDVIKEVLLRPLYLCATEVILDLMNIYVVLIYALLYAFFFAYPVIFDELYGYNDGIIGLMFIPILIGAAFALCVTPLCEKKFKAICKVRKPTPEDRLLGAMIGAPFIPISLFILGATSYKHIIWVGPASSGIAFGFGMVLVYYAVNNYIIDSYAKYAASALAAKVFVRSGGGAAFPLFTTQMYKAMGLQWASWMLAFVALAMVAIPYAFFFFGARLRARFVKANYAE